eukprot:6467040-Pyramimonas_sp.AAC.1
MELFRDVRPACSRLLLLLTRCCGGLRVGWRTALIALFAQADDQHTSHGGTCGWPPTDSQEMRDLSRSQPRPPVDEGF